MDGRTLTCLDSDGRSSSSKQPERMHRRRGTSWLKVLYIFHRTSPQNGTGDSYRCLSFTTPMLRTCTGRRVDFQNRNGRHTTLVLAGGITRAPRLGRLICFCSGCDWDRLTVLYPIPLGLLIPAWTRFLNCSDLTDIRYTYSCGMEGCQLGFYPESNRSVYLSTSGNLTILEDHLPRGYSGR
ncbi:hypothetical protein FA13DRAFT_901248 [Coprinellus micaceus]|uniref:Uncharacterized protein n=1 Tax=Coprinellus micaceus TaxID=71717 RepID=A0A4Y7TTR2_COPMI|nr:hypothetical protein FA13DRAFT_901248 [Coprinellus micaceus]